MTKEKNTKILKESLFPGDLIDLVLPVITIDEYVSKIDDSATVVGFYVIEEEPAKDLSRFIEFGPIEVLDVEVSPAPDENGKYLVFVEIQDSNLKTIAETVYEILNNVKYLTDIYNWKFTTRFGEGTIKIKK